MHLKNLGDRVAASVDDARDRAAEAMSTDEAPERRELDRVGRRLDRVGSELSGAMASLSADQENRFDSLNQRAKKTTWPRRLFWMLLGAAAGAAALFASDPTKR